MNGDVDFVQYFDEIKQPIIEQKFLDPYVV